MVYTLVILSLSLYIIDGGNITSQHLTLLNIEEKPIKQHSELCFSCIVVYNTIGRDTSNLTDVNQVSDVSEWLALNIDLQLLLDLLVDMLIKVLGLYQTKVLNLFL